MSITSPEHRHPPGPHDQQLQVGGLSRLLHLIQQMRRSENTEELVFLAVNETRQIMAYDEALLFFDYDGSSPKLQAVSGLAIFERETPKIAWLEKSISRFRQSGESSLDPVLLNIQSIDESDHEGWQEFMSPEAVIVPFHFEKTGLKGFFLLTRASVWSEKETKLLTEIAENFAYAYAAHTLKPGTSFAHILARKKTKILLGAALLTTIIMFWPVHETLIADMEITPISPWVATAPLEGVVRKVSLAPNTPVKPGDLLFEMDDTTLRNEVVLANERLEIARQELWQARQQAVSNTGDKKADASLRALEVKKKENEASYNQEMLAKTKITAGAEGIALFGSASEIEGKPIRTGEAIMMIADPTKVELTINMPVADAITIKPGDPVVAYLNANPFQPVKAKVRYISYKAQKTEIADQFAYKIKADLVDPSAETPRLGLKGTARVKGEMTTLFYVIFRNPIGYVRRMTGI